nr:translation initiation factor IF-2-like [Pan paniscus]
MGLRRASWCDHDSVRIPFRIAAGRGEPFRVPRTAQLAEPVRRCAPPPPQIQQRPPPAHSHTVAHTHGHAPRRWSGPPRARGGPAPLPWPYLCGGLCRGAAPVHGARRPASAAHSRSPPRRGDSGRFEFTTARPVPNLPPPGSQRHVTTGAAEGQSPAPAAAAWGRGGTAGAGARAPPPPERAGSPKPLPRQGGRPRRVGLRCHGDHQPGFLWDWPELKFPDPLSLRSTRVPGRPRGWPMVTGVFGLSWLMRGWEPVGRLQRGLRQAPEASLPGPFSGRAPRPQCGRLRSRRSRDGGGAPGRP